MRGWPSRRVWAQAAKGAENDGERTSALSAILSFQWFDPRSLLASDESPASPPCPSPGIAFGDSDLSPLPRGEVTKPPGIRSERWSFGLQGFRWALPILLLVLVCPAFADPFPGDAAMLARHGLAPGDAAYIVFDAEEGTIVAARDAERAMMPASLIKIATTFAALAILGPDHRFATTLAATGTVADGVLDGDLILIGGGDPFLDTPDLTEFVSALRRAGIRRVAGRFIVDGTLLIGSTAIEPTQPYAATYNPGVSALSLNFNRLRLSWQRRGRSVDATAEAVADDLVLPMGWVRAGLGDAGMGAARPYLPDGQGWMLSPALPDNGSAFLPIRDAAWTAGAVFTVLAARDGIDLPPPELGAAPAGAVVLARHDSPPLAEIVRQVLEFSNNLSAELIGMAAARALTGTPVDQATAGRVLAEWYAARLPQLDWSGFAMPAMSGLSARTRVTPAQLGTILLCARSRAMSDFYGLLPEEAGPAPGRVRAKTGTMSYASGLAGYLKADSGRLLGFVMFETDAEARAALDANPDPEVLAAPPAAARWAERARAFQRELLAAWAAAY